MDERIHKQAREKILLAGCDGKEKIRVHFLGRDQKRIVGGVGGEKKLGQVGAGFEREVGVSREVEHAVRVSGGPVEEWERTHWRMEPCMSEDTTKMGLAKLEGRAETTRIRNGKAGGGVSHKH